MIVDDDLELRESVCEFLHDEGYRVLSASDGAAALAHLRDGEKPALILLDLMMPGMNGWQFREAQIRDSQLAEIPVVVMTASRDVRDIEVSEVVYKPLKLTRLLDVVGRYAGASDPRPAAATNDIATAMDHKKELARLRRAAEVERDQLRELLGQAPAIVNFLRGPELVFEYAHPLAVQSLGGRQVVGKPLLDAVPEMRGQEYSALLRRVFETGERIEGRDKRVWLDRDGSGQLRETYWNFVYLPVRDDQGRIDGVMTFDIEVTDQVLARRRLEESEAKFRGLVAQVQAGIAQVDLTGRFILTNERYREIVGRSESELQQLRMQDITHPDDLGGNVEQFHKLATEGTPFIVEKRYVRPDGSIVWVQNSVSRIDDGEGRAQGIAAVTMDITQRKTAEHALRESEERFRNMFEAAAVSLWEEDFSAVKVLVDELERSHGDGLRAFLEANPGVVADAVGRVRILDVNPATLRLLGATSKQEVLESLHRIFLPETHALFLEELVAIAENRRLVVADTALQTLSGQRLDVAFSIAFPSGDERYERVLVSLTDITSAKIAEREREARLAEMERAVRFSEMFVGVLGHDLRNPLSAITVAAHLLNARADSERIATPVRRIVASADRMERMISQLLDFTRIRLGGGLPLAPTDSDLSVIARSIIDELEPVHGRKIQLKAVGNSAGTWDPDRLSQLLSNLVANACQHGASGEPIVVEVDGSDREVVCVVVANRGVIPPELVPVVFEPLRPDDGRKRRVRSSGLGLGLYITQQIATAHGGTIRVESNGDLGTRFSVELPRHARLD